MQGRRRVRNVIIVTVAFIAGYLESVRMYPAPLFPKDHALPRLLDLGITEAQKQLTSQGFRIRIADEEPDPRLPKGKVVWQDPAPGTTLPAGSTVTLTPSAGPAQIPIPDVIGFEATEARKVLLAAGFATGEEDSVTSGIDVGAVVATRPAPGAARDAGSPVDLILSAGPGPVNVPSVVGLPLPEARVVIRRAGLTVGTIQAGNGGAFGSVLRQDPAPGSRTARDTRVDLIVSRGESP